MPLRPRNADGLLASVSKRRKHFLRKRALAAVFEEANMYGVAQALRDCQETEVLACCSHCGASWYITHKCRKRICPLCSYEIAQERAQYLKLMTHKMKWPKLVTLTMPQWTDVPQDGVKFLRRSFNALRRHKVFAHVEGGAYNIEIVPKQHGWHIHLHALISSPYLPYQQLFTAWRQIIGEDCPQVDIRAAQSEQARIYAAKYAAKSVDFNARPHDMVRWYEATRGVRLFSTFGKWYNAKMEDLADPSIYQRPVAQCPQCKAIKTIFLATQGPYIWGFDDWRTMESAFTRGNPSVRPLEHIERALSAEYAAELKAQQEQSDRSATRSAKKDVTP